MQAVAALWRRHAFVLGSVVTGAKTCAADILVQTGYEGRETIDWRRNCVFSSCAAAPAPTAQISLPSADTCVSARSRPLLSRRLPVCAVHAMVPTPVPRLRCCRRREARRLRPADQHWLVVLPTVLCSESTQLASLLAPTRPCPARLPAPRCKAKPSAFTPSLVLHRHRCSPV